MLIIFLEDLKESLFNHSNCSHPSLEVVAYLFLSLKGRQSSILWSALCRFHWLYHYSHSQSLIACHSLLLFALLIVTLCHLLHHSLSLVVIRCHSLYHSLSFVVTRCITCCYSLSLDVPLVCLFINNRNKIDYVRRYFDLFFFLVLFSKKNHGFISEGST